MIQIYEVAEEKLKESSPSVFNQIERKNARFLAFERLAKESSIVANVKGKLSTFQRSNENPSSSTQFDRDT